ncbi:hypothetical protein KSF78_0008497 [Schistosoma japonicum]|nr:hypothetical protein KSF78_0008497 [Schistosoma japonicum]KAH8874777.1 hypothetical protein KSF78_0008497 [Schistosoma japonicum]
MWYEILPPLGIMLGSVVVLSPLIKLTTYAIYGRWYPPQLFRFKQDYFLHLRNEDLGGPLILKVCYHVNVNNVLENFF